jgi:hypothetical protein
MKGRGRGCRREEGGEKERGKRGGRKEGERGKVEPWLEMGKGCKMQWPRGPEPLI